jgi:twitching motility two-component system response regulator PilH
MSYILIIEDHRQYAKIIEMLLDQMGIPHRHAPDGTCAIDIAKAEKPLLVLLDLNLPDMNGWEILDTLRDTYDEYSFPVIVSTAQTDPANRMIARFQFIKRYVTKPYELSELREAIEEALELYKVAV